MISKPDFDSFTRRLTEQLWVDQKIPLDNGLGCQMVHFKVHLQLHHKLDLPIKTIGGSSGWKQEKRGAERVGLQFFSQTLDGVTLKGLKNAIRGRTSEANGAY